MRTKNVLMPLISTSGSYIENMDHKLVSISRIKV